MNPFPIAFATLRRYPATTVLFILVIAIAVALGVGISAQERALRSGSAQAADRFDVIVAAPGSPTEIVFNTIFLQPSAVQLLDKAIVAKLFSEPQAEIVAPIGYGDYVDQFPVIGTIPAFVQQVSRGLSEGRVFQAEGEAVVGADVTFTVGDRLEPMHGTAAPVPGGQAEGHQHYEITVVGRMKRIGNPWDRAVVIPIESIWEAHGLPNGHADGVTAIGPPFDPARLPGLPALVLKPKSFGAAYTLRQTYRTERSMAFFPAEVLFQLYNVLGNIRSVMSVMAIVTEVLVFLAIFAGVFALMKLFERQFAVLRALGASRLYVFAAVWLFASLIVVAGVALGLLLGYGAAEATSAIIAKVSGVALSATLGRSEVMLAISGAVAGILLATIPAALLYRGSVASLLR